MDGQNSFWKRHQLTWMATWKAQNPDRIAWLAVLAGLTILLLWLSTQQSNWTLGDQPNTENWPPGVQVGVQIPTSNDAPN